MSPKPPPKRTPALAGSDDVRRIDVGDGIYVRVPVPELAAASVGVQADLPAGGAAAQTGGVKWQVPPIAVPAAAVCAGSAFARYGATREGWFAAGVLAVLAVLAAIDLRWRVLPNRIVLPATGAVLAWQIAFASDRLPEWIGAGLGAAAFLTLPSLIRRGAMGMGDVKLSLLLGVALGAAVFDALLIAFLATVPVTLTMLARGRGGVRGATLPFGPFLALGAAVALLA